MIVIFDCGMIVGVRCWFQYLLSLGFSMQQPLESEGNGVKKQKHPVCSSSTDKNALLMRGVRGEEGQTE